MLKLYNTLSGKKEIFKPAKDKQVGFYACGPTVYWYQHIGNLRTYIFNDLLRRTLLSLGYKVKMIINVTDVGHLTSDADEGEDKIEKIAKKEGKTAKEIADYYLAVFKSDFEKLNITEPDVWARATDHTKEMIDLIKKLERKGFTYKTSDGIYFNTSKFKNYGELAKLKKQKLKAGKRISLKEKKSITDFALWKFSKNPGERQQEWPSPWGLGYPGWHIECSAMSMKYLGNTLDIHTGGQEHIPVHHTNEIAQSEAATEKKFVKYWLHTRWLLFKGEKMSKSKGEIYTISELEKKDINPLSFRYFTLGAHYRRPLTFSWTALSNAQKSYERLKNIISELKDDGIINKKYLLEFQKAISDDIDTAKALAVLWKLLRDKKTEGKLNTVREMDNVLGLDLTKKTKKEKVPQIVLDRVNLREKYRKEKDWQKADEVRKEVEKMGWQIEDTNTGPKIKK